VNLVQRVRAVIREAIATAWAQPVASIVTIVMVAGMCATVLLTTGRTVGAEHAVLGSIDSAGTRSIIVRADPDAGVTTSVLDRLSHVDGIEWAGAFGSAQDVRNSLVPDGTKVPMRYAWSTDFAALGVPQHSAVTDQTGYASDQALVALGMPDAVGGATSIAGESIAVAGRVQTPDYLNFLEPLLLVPHELDPNDPQPVAIIVVIAARPDLVSPVSDTVLSVLAADDVTKVQLTTSEGLAELRALVEGQLGSFGRNLVVIIFALTAVLVAAILYGLVMLRRKDFGRRRALGASQSLIVALLLSQITALSIVGAVVGSVAASIALAAAGDPLPGIEFIVSVDLLAVAVGVVAALVPALAAARRDPLTELRVP
jgi:putative ABC transport system permease protein